MGIEITYDETEAAASMGLGMDPDRHHVMADGDWIRWARKEFGKPDLFQYYHAETKRFVLAEWVRRPERGGMPVCVELESYEHPIDSMPSQLAPEYLRVRLQPSSKLVERMKTRMREAASLKKQMAQLRGEKRKECAKRLKSMGMELEAMNVEQGRVDMDFFEDEGLAEITESINHLAALDNRITSVPGISPGGSRTRG